MNTNDVVIDGMDLVKDFYTKMPMIHRSKANNPRDRESMEWVMDGKDEKHDDEGDSYTSTCTSKGDASSTFSNIEVHSTHSVDSFRADLLSVSVKPLA